jgi:hypothetical protein
MGRTVPSFRIVIAEEKAEWKPFRDALDKKERKEFVDIFDIPRNYVSACSNSVQLDNNGSCRILKSIFHSLIAGCRC